MAFKEKRRKELQRLSLGLFQHLEIREVRRNQHRRLVVLGWPGRRKTERKCFWREGGINYVKCCSKIE